MPGEVEVVEIGAANSLLPNLTICVDKDEDEEGAKPEILYEEEGKSMEEFEEKVEPDVKMKLTNFPRKKIYENKRLEAISSLGLSFEEAKKRRGERAKRFASPLNEKEETSAVEEDEGLPERVKLLKERIAEHNLKYDAADDEYIRTDALHLRGVNDMSTDDIFSYFGSADPKRIEWIDDTSCNVVWDNGDRTAETYEKIVKRPELETPTSKPDLKSEADDTLDLMTEDEPDISMEVDNTTDQEKNEKDNEEKKNLGLNPLLPCKESFEKSGQKMTLEIRYAELRDRKVLGAAKRSKYYINHGNPNYGGTKGLLSSAFRKRYQMSHARNELMNMNVPITNSRRDNNDDSGDSNHYRGKWSRRNKMRSDDVEEEDGKSKEELEDDQLIKSSAKDLTDAIPVNDSGDDSDGFGTMVADQVAKTVKEAREMKERGNFHLQVTTSNSNIRSRLGKRSHSSVSRDKNVLDRLPTALRNRLGNKRSKDSSQDNNSFRSRDRYHDHRNHSHRDSEKFKRVKEEKDNSSPITRTIKSGRESRSLKRYSPTPWDSSDEDLDMF